MWLCAIHHTSWQGIDLCDANALLAVCAPSERRVWARLTHQNMHIRTETHSCLKVLTASVWCCVSCLPVTISVCICHRYAKLEKGLGEIDRARAIYVHPTVMADPRQDPSYWADWNAFEVRNPCPPLTPPHITPLSPCSPLPPLSPFQRFLVAQFIPYSLCTPTVEVANAHLSVVMTPTACFCTSCNPKYRFREILMTGSL